MYICIYIHTCIISNVQGKDSLVIPKNSFCISLKFPLDTTDFTAMAPWSWHWRGETRVMLRVCESEISATCGIPCLVALCLVALSSCCVSCCSLSCCSVAAYQGIALFSPALFSPLLSFPTPCPWSHCGQIGLCPKQTKTNFWT